jgi:putative transposase
MARSRVHYRNGQVVFITMVTYQRRPCLIKHRRLLYSAAHRTIRRLGVELVEWVVLPDHVHLIVRVSNEPLSGVIRAFKLSMTSRLSPEVKPLWQDGYWDRAIRTDSDLKHRIDYIRLNAVKHGYADEPSRWMYSSHVQINRGGTEDGAALQG